LQKINNLIIVSIALLTAIGIIFSYSLSIFLEINKNLSFYHFLNRYIFFFFLEFLTIIILSRLDPDKYFNIIGWSIFILSSILLIVLPFLPSSLAPTIKGAHRWINIGIIKISPVEFFKIGVIFFLSWSFTRKVGNKSLKEELLQILYYVIFLGFFWVFIIVYQSDLGQVILMLIIFTLMLFIAGGKLQTVGIISILGIIFFMIAIIIAPYRLYRIKLWLIRIHQIFFNDSSNIPEISHSQIQQSINTIYQGGFFGNGIGNGDFKLGYLSDINTDFVLSGIAEETGFLGIFIIVILILILIYGIFKIAFRINKKEYQLFAFGIGSLIGVEFLFNAFGITGMIPLKGLTVPFISYGGSSLIALSIGIGMVLMISKKVKL